MKHEFALKKPKPAKHTGGQRGNNNSRKDGHGNDEMAIMDVVLTARCKLLGWKLNEANKRTAKAEHLGSTAGIAIELAGFDRDRWQACEDIRKTYHTYWSLIGKSPFPQNAAIQILPEETFTDPDEKPREVQTEQEKADRFTSVANRKMKMITWIALGAGPMAQHFTDVVTLFHEAKPGFIQALDGVMGKMK